MEHFLNLHKNKNIFITLPSNKFKTLEIEVNDMKDEGENIVIYVKPKNLENFKILTKNVIHYYIHKQLKSYLPLFSINKEIKIRFV
jgi:hypothetical protein